MKNIEEIIKNTTSENQDKTDWTSAWSSKYPVLSSYQKEVEISKYASKIRKMIEELKREYHYNELDAMLILKDILYHEWKDKKNN